MARTYTDDHLGTLTVECRGEITVEVRLRLADARFVLADLAQSRNVSIVCEDGHLHAVSGISFIAAQWEPTV